MLLVEKTCLEPCNWAIVSYTVSQWSLQSHISNQPEFSKNWAHKENGKKPPERQLKEKKTLRRGAIGSVDRDGQYWYTEKSESIRTVICFSLFSIYPSTLYLKWKSGYEFKVLTFNSKDVGECSPLHWVSNVGLIAAFIHSPPNLGQCSTAF